MADSKSSTFPHFLLFLLAGGSEMVSQHLLRIVEEGGVGADNQLSAKKAVPSEVNERIIT